LVLKLLLQLTTVQMVRTACTTVHAVITVVVLANVQCIVP